jgi:hypothetical protein
MQGLDTFSLPNLPIAISSADSHCSLSRTPRQQFNPQGKLRNHKHGRPWEGAGEEKLTIGMILCGWLLAALPLRGASYYPIRFDDPQAVYLTPDHFPVHADCLPGVVGSRRKRRRRPNFLFKGIAPPPKRAMISM